MINYLLRWTLILSGLFALPVLLIRAQPYDDSELRAFLIPQDGCPKPCFMGIRPGAVNVNEAIAILESHEWVDRAGEDYVRLMQAAVDYNVSPVTSTLVWEWSATIPDWINADRRSYLVVGDQQLIVAITVQTTIPLGDVLMTYGIPETAQLVQSKDGLFGHSYAYNVWYRSHCMRIDAGGAGSPRHVYSQPVQLQVLQSDSLDTASTTLPNANCGQ